MATEGQLLVLDGWVALFWFEFRFSERHLPCRRVFGYWIVGGVVAGLGSTGQQALIGVGKDGFGRMRGRQ